MALATYTDLQAAIAGFLNRDDLTAVIPDFIALAEAQLNRDVRHWRMWQRETALIDNRYATLPDDWVETVRLTMSNASSGYRALQLLSVDQMERMRAEAADTPGVPRYYAHIGAELEVFPTPDASYTGELVYVGKLLPLSDTQPDNWLLLNAPDCYLYAALIQSAPYLAADERVAVWGSLYTAAVAALNKTSDAARTSGTTLRIRPPR